MNADNSKIKEFVEQGMQDVNLAWEVLQRARGIGSINASDITPIRG